MTNHYWDRVTAPHADRDRSEPDMRSSAEQAEAVAHAVAVTARQYEDTIARVVALRDDMEASPQGHRVLRSAIAAALSNALRGPETTAHCEGHGGPGRWYCCQHPDAGWPCTETVEDKS